MPQIWSKIAKKGVKIGNSAQKLAKFDVFRTKIINKGVNPDSPIAALLAPGILELTNITISATLLLLLNSWTFKFLDKFGLCIVS